MVRRVRSRIRNDLSLEKIVNDAIHNIKLWYSQKGLTGASMHNCFSFLCFASLPDCLFSAQRYLNSNPL